MTTSFKYSIVFTLLLCNLLCFSCKKSTFQEEVVELTSDNSVEELSDSTFFSHISCIVEYEGDVFASLTKRRQIIRMDEDLNLKNVIGTEGRGPKEFLSIGNFVVADDIVWAGNPGVLAIMKFTRDGEFIGVEGKTEKRYTLDTRFVIESEVIYFTKVDLEKKTSLAILYLNKDGEDSYMQFGSFTDFGFTTKNTVQNKRHVFVTEDYIIAVPISIPIIEKYDRRTLELIETFDVTFHPAIKDNYENVLKKPDYQQSNSSFSIVSDAYLKENVLYITYAGLTERDGKMERLGIMAFDINGAIRYLKRYAFESTPDKICVTDDYIYTAPVSGGVIDRYPLNQ